MNANRERFLLLIPFCMGIIFFWQIIGFSVLNPQKIDWLLTGDPLQHYVGWEFFRKSEWALPLGLNPLYGLEISSSIVYSDSIPLLALLFKGILNFYSAPFQYFVLAFNLLCIAGHSCVDVVGPHYK